MKASTVARVIIRGRGGAPNRMAVHCRGASSCSVLRQLSRSGAGSGRLYNMREAHDGNYTKSNERQNCFSLH